MVRCPSMTFKPTDLVELQNPLANMCLVILGRSMGAQPSTHDDQSLHPCAVPTNISGPPLPAQLLLLACHRCSSWHVGSE